MITANPSGEISDFLSYLNSLGNIDDVRSRQLVQLCDASGQPVDVVMIELGLSREEALARHLSEFFNVEYCDEIASLVDDAMVDRIGLKFLTDNGFFPVRPHKPDGYNFVICNPFDRESLRMLEYFLSTSIRFGVSSRSAIVTALSSLNPDEHKTRELERKEYAVVSDIDIEKLRDFAQQAPVVRIVSRIVQAASDERATDIHIEPAERDIKVRMRVDGMLQVFETLPVTYLPGISTRIKIMAGLNISERRLPQDGRFSIVVRGQEIELRVSIIPSLHGETIALRLLDRSNVELDLAKLGFDATARDTITSLAKLPNGIMLVTGPTGSGKTTTLYSLISLLNSPDVKIFTIEDPIEYEVAGVTQLQINTATGLTFAKTLRSVLRQDPDIILLGEIRDRETAEIAMQASLTGHLVFSTLHTNSATGAVTRLREMGIEH